jgi:hypothetical protein
MEAFKDEFGNWRHLPFSGGVLEQPEQLMEDLLTWRSLGDSVQAQLRKRWQTKDAPSG